MQFEMNISQDRECSKIVVTAKQSACASEFLLDCLDQWCLERLDNFVDITAPRDLGLFGVQSQDFVSSQIFFYSKAGYYL